MMEEKEDKYRRLISTLLSCGLNDIDVIEDICDDIISEAIETLNTEEINVTFPSLYRECAEIALALEGIRGEIDSNYGCACISILKGYDKEAVALVNLGFSIDEVE